MTPFADLVEVLVAPLWSALVVVILFVVAWILRRPLGRMLRDLGISRLSFLGVDIEWIANRTQDAYRERELPAPEPGALQAFAVLSARLAPLVRDRRVLWVDDRPAGNVTETRLLRRLGVDVENATTTAAALARLRDDPARFDLVISDWTRNGPDDSGIALLTQMGAAGMEIPVVMYAGEASPQRRAQAAELGAIGLTTQPDELLKHVLVELATAG